MVYFERTSAVSLVNQPTKESFKGWLGDGFTAEDENGVFPIIRSYKDFCSLMIDPLRGCAELLLLLALEEEIALVSRDFWIVMERRISSFAKTSSKGTNSWLVCRDAEDEVESNRLSKGELDSILFYILCVLRRSMSPWLHSRTQTNGTSQPVLLLITLEKEKLADFAEHKKIEIRLFPDFVTFWASE